MLLSDGKNLFISVGENNGYKVVIGAGKDTEEIFQGMSRNRESKGKLYMFVYEQEWKKCKGQTAAAYRDNNGKTYISKKEVRAERCRRMGGHKGNGRKLNILIYVEEERNVKLCL